MKLSGLQIGEAQGRDRKCGIVLSESDRFTSGSVGEHWTTVTSLFYPWVMYLLTVRITEAFGLPKPSLFCNVQRDVASLPSYSKLNLNLSHVVLI